MANLSLNSLPELYLAVARQTIQVAIKKALIGFARKQVDKINELLATAKVGDKILDTFVVISRSDADLVLQFRRVEAGKGFARLRVSMDDSVSLSDDGDIQINNLTLVSLTLEFEVSSNSYSAALGYGFDQSIEPTYEVGRALIQLKMPSLRLEAVFASSSNGGFVVDFSAGMSRFPLVIPLGSTGFALQGIGGTFAHKFVPRLDPDSDEDPEDLPSAFPGKYKDGIQANHYVAWAQRTRGAEVMDAWLPVKSGKRDAGGFGLRTDIIDMLSSGYVIRLFDAGFLVLTNGPIVILGGDGQILELDRNTAAIGFRAALDFSTLSFAGSGTASFALPSRDSAWKVIEGGGSVETLLPLKNPRTWYNNVGTESSPIWGKFLTSVIEASVYLMLNNDRVATGASVKFGNDDIDFIVGRVKAYFGIAGKGVLGWNPGHLLTKGSLFGGIEICVLGICIGIDLRGNIAIALAKPLQLLLDAEYKIGLPWPIPDIEGSVTIFNYKEAVTPPINRPVLAASLVAGEFNATLNTPSAVGALHGITGRQWELKESGDKATIWPDSEIVLPFSRRLLDKTPGKIVLNAPTSPIREGGVHVSHFLDFIKVFHVTESTRDELQDVRAMWVEGPAGPDKASLPISRLHMPGEDPFEWLTAHQEIEDGVRIIDRSNIEQRFGVGDSVLAIVSPKLFDDVSIDPLEREMDLLDMDRATFETRLLSLSQAVVSFKSSVGLLTVASVVFSFVGERAPDLIVDPEFEATPVDNAPTKVGSTLVHRVLVKRKDNTVFNAVHIEVNRVGNCTAMVGWGTNSVSRAEGCSQRALLWTLQYLLVTTMSGEWKERTVFLPGSYEFEAYGSSEWKVSGGQVLRGEWRLSRQFDIDYPTHLRPYVKRMNLGDNRVIDGDATLWNPVPMGLGFPVYRETTGVLTSKVPYLDKVFFNPAKQFLVRIAPDHEPTAAFDPSTSIAASIQPNPLGETGLTEAAEKWRELNGAAKPVLSEITVNANWGRGKARMEIWFIGEAGDDKRSPLKVEEIEFEGSSFATFEAHFSWNSLRLEGAAGPLGPVDILGSPEEGLSPAAMSEQAAAPPSSWLLPNQIVMEIPGVRVGAQTAFLRLTHRLACVIDEGSDNLTRPYLSVSEKIEYWTLLDRKNRGYCVWIRTPEPVDWRRVTIIATATYIDTNGKTRSVRFDTNIVPSIDASSAFVFLAADDQFIRLPRALLDFDISYKLVQAELPALRRASDPSNLEPWIVKHRVANPFGEVWSND